MVREDGSVVSYKYDGLGRRIEKDVAGITTGYIYDNDDILLELDGTSTIVARYTHGPGIDEPLIVEKGGNPFFYHLDGLGSTTELSDTIGTVVQSYTYSSFGKIESQLDPTFVQPYNFTSREFDIETGLYHYRARAYESSIGRFLQEDPIALAGGINFYTVVANNPINYSDPLGLYTVDDLIVDAANFSAGFGDTLTSGFGLSYLVGLPSLTEAIRESLGTNDVIDRCSGFYTGGKWAGYAWGVALGTAVAARTGVGIFAHGGKNWHLGLELAGKRNLIHIGNQVGRGVHVAIGYVGPKFGWLHIYFQRSLPFIRLWWP